MKRSRVLLMSLAALAIAFLVACGGDDDNSSSIDSNGPAGSATLDLSEGSAKLAQAKSFRFDMTMKLDLGKPSASSSSADSDLDAAFLSALLGSLGDIKAEGSFVAPDKTDVKVRLGGQEVAMIQIADKAWVKIGDTWQVATAEDGFEVTGISPRDIVSELPAEQLKGAKTSSENVNGVKATRYSFNKAALEQMARDAGESTEDFADLSKADLSIWTNPEGMPVKVALNFAGKDDTGQTASMVMEMNIRNINDNGIQIKAPI